MKSVWIEKKAVEKYICNIFFIFINAHYKHICIITLTYLHLYLHLHSYIFTHFAVLQKYDKRFEETGAHKLFFLWAARSGWMLVLWKILLMLLKRKKKTNIYLKSVLPI